MPTPTTEQLEELVQLARDMRSAQKDYFKNRHNADLNTSKYLEKRFDQRVKEIYDGPDVEPQMSLF